MNKSPVKVAIEPLQSGYDSALHNAFSWIEALRGLRPNARVFIKPNLTFPTYRQGVMTNPECIEALVITLKSYTDHITVGEADSGGYNRFSMTEVFESIGLNAMARRYGFKVSNLSFLPSRVIAVPQAGRGVIVSLPAPVLDDTDLFITVPVPKVHANVGVSLSIKNQWGLIQEPKQRLALHCRFADVVHAVNRALPPTISIIDGRYGLTRNGPMRGDTVLLDWLLASDNLYVADMVCCRLMGIDCNRIAYLRRILSAEGLSPETPITYSNDPAQFITARPFYLRRNLTDWPGVIAFRSRIAAYIGYQSFLARPLHRCLYWFREPFY
jgi:uncharacterized protein (DUF362 family)